MRLQRITSSGRWIPEIDALRFIAIFAVLLVHCMGPLQTDPRFRIALSGHHPLMLREIYHLGRGVQLFFVISGFILAQPFLRHLVDKGKAVDLKAFYLRRITRLEPPYILSLLLYAGGIALLRHGKHADVGYSLLSSLAYIHNFLQWLEPINNSTWSLEVEIQFYLLAPLISLVYAIRGAGLRRGVLSGAIAVFALLPHAKADHVGFYLASNICYFLIGYLLADLRIHQVTAWCSVWWDVGALVAWPTLLLLPEDAPSILVAATLTGCFTSAFLGPFSRRLMQIRWVALIGGMCYSIYLLHDLVISALYPLFKRVLVFNSIPADYILLLLLLLGPILLVSTGYFLLVERPCMDPRWPQKLWHMVSRRDTAPDAEVL